MLPNIFLEVEDGGVTFMPSQDADVVESFVL